MEKFNKNKKWLSAVVALIFFFNTCATAFARQGNYGDPLLASSVWAAGMGAVSGVQLVLSCNASEFPLEVPLGEAIGGCIGTAFYFLFYPYYGEIVQIGLTPDQRDALKQMCRNIGIPESWIPERGIPLKIGPIEVTYGQVASVIGGVIGSWAAGSIMGSMTDSAKLKSAELEAAAKEGELANPIGEADSEIEAKATKAGDAAVETAKNADPKLSDTDAKSIRAQAYANSLANDLKATGKYTSEQIADKISKSEVVQKVAVGSRPQIIEAALKQAGFSQGVINSIMPHYRLDVKVDGLNKLIHWFAQADDDFTDWCANAIGNTAKYPIVNIITSLTLTAARYVWKGICLAVQGLLYIVRGTVLLFTNPAHTWKDIKGFFGAVKHWFTSFGGLRDKVESAKFKEGEKLFTENPEAFEANMRDSLKKSFNSYAVKRMRTDKAFYYAVNRQWELSVGSLLIHDIPLALAELVIRSAIQGSLMKSKEEGGLGWDEITAGIAANAITEGVVSPILSGLLTGLELSLTGDKSVELAKNGALITEESDKKDLDEAQNFVENNPIEVKVKEEITVDAKRMDDARGSYERAMEKAQAQAGVGVVGGDIDNPPDIDNPRTGKAVVSTADTRSMPVTEYGKLTVTTQKSGELSLNDFAKMAGTRGGLTSISTEPDKEGYLQATFGNGSTIALKSNTMALDSKLVANIKTIQNYFATTQTFAFRTTGGLATSGNGTSLAAINRAYPLLGPAFVVWQNEGFGLDRLISGALQVHVLNKLGYTSYYGRNLNVIFENTWRMALAQAAGNLAAGTWNNLNPFNIKGVISGTGGFEYKGLLWLEGTRNPWQTKGDMNIGEYLLLETSRQAAVAADTAFWSYVNAKLGIYHPAAQALVHLTGSTLASGAVDVFLRADPKLNKEIVLVEQEKYTDDAGIERVRDGKKLTMEDLEKKYGDDILEPGKLKKYFDQSKKMMVSLKKKDGSFVLFKVDTDYVSSKDKAKLDIFMRGAGYRIGFDTLGVSLAEDWVNFATQAAGDSDLTLPVSRTLPSGPYDATRYLRLSANFQQHIQTMMGGGTAMDAATGRFIGNIHNWAAQNFGNSAAYGVVNHLPILFGMEHHSYATFITTAQRIAEEKKMAQDKIELSSGILSTLNQYTGKPGRLVKDYKKYLRLLELADELSAYKGDESTPDLQYLQEKTQTLDLDGALAQQAAGDESKEAEIIAKAKIELQKRIQGLNSHDRALVQQAAGDESQMADLRAKARSLEDAVNYVLRHNAKVTGIDDLRSIRPSRLYRMIKQDSPEARQSLIREINSLSLRNTLSEIPLVGAYQVRGLASSIVDYSVSGRAEHSPIGLEKIRPALEAFSTGKDIYGNPNVEATDKAYFQKIIKEGASSNDIRTYNPSVAGVPKAQEVYGRAVVSDVFSSHPSFKSALSVGAHLTTDQDLTPDDVAELIKDLKEIAPWLGDTPEEVEKNIQLFGEGVRIYSPESSLLERTTVDRFGRMEETTYYGQEYAGGKWRMYQKDKMTEHYYGPFGYAGSLTTDYSSIKMPSLWPQTDTASKFEEVLDMATLKEIGDIIRADRYSGKRWDVKLQAVYDYLEKKGIKLHVYTADELDAMATDFQGERATGENGPSGKFDITENWFRMYAQVRRAGFSADSSDTEYITQVLEDALRRKTPGASPGHREITAGGNMLPGDYNRTEKRWEDNVYTPKGPIALPVTEEAAVGTGKAYLPLSFGPDISAEAKFYLTGPGQSPYTEPAFGIGASQFNAWPSLNTTAHYYYTEAHATNEVNRLLGELAKIEAKQPGNPRTYLDYDKVVVRLKALVKEQYKDYLKYKADAEKALEQKSDSESVLSYPEWLDNQVRTNDGLGLKGIYDQATEMAKKLESRQNLSHSETITFNQYQRLGSKQYSLPGLRLIAGYNKNDEGKYIINFSDVYDYMHARENITAEIDKAKTGAKSRVNENFTKFLEGVDIWSAGNLNFVTTPFSGFMPESLESFFKYHTSIYVPEFADLVEGGVILRESIGSEPTVATIDMLPLISGYERAIKPDAEEAPTELTTPPVVPELSAQPRVFKANYSKIDDRPFEEAPVSTEAPKPDLFYKSKPDVAPPATNESEQEAKSEMPVQPSPERKSQAPAKAPVSQPAPVVPAETAPATTPPAETSPGTGTWGDAGLGKPTPAPAAPKKSAPVPPCRNIP
jgi:hypothetical protein